MGDDKFRVSDIKLLNIPKSKEELTNRLSDFLKISYRGTVHIDVINESISNEIIVCSYELLDMTIDENTDVTLFDVWDHYHLMEPKFYIDFETVVDVIYNDIMTKTT